MRKRISMLQPRMIKPVILSRRRRIPAFVFTCVLLLSVLCSVTLHAQTIQIKLVNGKTGQPVTSVSWFSPRKTLNVGLGRDSDLSLVLTADKQGVIQLRFTRNDSEINVPECKGMRTAWNQLLKSQNKDEVKEFNKKYKNCMNYPMNNPIAGFVDTILIGPIFAGGNYFRFIQCWVEFPAFISTEEVLQHGVVTPNSCGSATASPHPGQLILFVRPPTQMEAGRQAWD